MTPLPAESPTIRQAGALDKAQSGEQQVVAIADHVREIALADPHRVALIHASSLPGGRIRYRRHTYREMSDRAESLAVGLREIGISEGTLVSFMVPPSLDAMVFALALWRVGAVLVGIEPHSHGLVNVARSLAKVGPEVFIGTPRAHAGRLSFGWGRRSIKTNVVVGPVGLPGTPTMRHLERHGVPAELQSGAISPEDPAVIAFTTGSTGAPKPTVLRQRNLAAMMQLVLEQWGYTDGRDVVDMVTFPMFWIIGLSAGGTSVIPPMDFTLKGPGDANPALLVKTIQDCGVRSMFASPALLTNLAQYANARDITLPTIERIVAGGAEVPGPLFADVKRALAPTGEMYSDYGATEAIPVSEIAGTEVLESTWPDTDKGSGVCVGKPLHGVEVRIVAIDDEPIATWDDAVELPQGSIGEVVVRSPHVSEEYYRQPRADQENKIEDPTGRWHRVGDTGYLDAEGRLWVCGRRSHRVSTERGVLYPLCCEPVLNTHPGVKRSALVGVEDSHGNTTAVMCVEPEGHQDRDRLEGELRSFLDGHDATRLVDRITFIDRLPVDRRHNAKIDRPRLARELSANL